MRLMVNGKSFEYKDAPDLGSLAAHLKLPTHGTAIELNGTIIRRGLYSSTPLGANDQLEIIRLVGGG